MVKRWVFARGLKQSMVLLAQALVLLSFMTVLALLAHLLSTLTPLPVPVIVYMMIPGEGVLFETGVYVDVTTITGVTIYYG